MKYAERSTGVAPLLSTSIHSSSRDEKVPLPSQSCAGPAMNSLSMSWDWADAVECAPARSVGAAIAMSRDARRMGLDLGGGDVAGARAMMNAISDPQRT